MLTPTNGSNVVKQSRSNEIGYRTFELSVYVVWINSPPPQIINLECLSPTRQCGVSYRGQVTVARIFSSPQVEATRTQGSLTSLCVARDPEELSTQPLSLCTPSLFPAVNRSLTVSSLEFRGSGAT